MKTGEIISIEGVPWSIVRLYSDAVPCVLRTEGRVSNLNRGSRIHELLGVPIVISKSFESSIGCTEIELGMG
jgi:hypothetical protein